MISIKDEEFIKDEKFTEYEFTYPESTGSHMA